MRLLPDFATLHTSTIGTRTSAEVCAEHFGATGCYARPMLPADLEISTDPSRIDLDVVYGFLRTSYWAQTRSRDEVERSIANSIAFGAYTSGRQVAFARVVTDRAVFAYLADVFVVPEFRGRGISKALMRAILAHPDLVGIRMILLRTQDAHGLYAQFGFEEVPAPAEMMVRMLPQAPI
jgi:GNAT superfamily N-acetyltransferase